MNKHELIEKYKELEKGSFDIVALVVCQLILKDLEQLDEPHKVTIPQVVADYIKWTKEEDYHLLGAMDTIMTSRRKNLYEWFYDDDNIELFAQAWIFGYEVEKEKRYTVMIKKTKQPLYYNVSENKLFFSMAKIASHFTRQQLEKINFGWVFDCEGMEVEEVEE